MATERLDGRRLLNLLGGWAAAVLLPGIVAIPWAGRGHEEFQIPAYLLWGVGYLAQMLLFIAIASITGTTQMWPWLVASVLPWIINLTAPDNPMYLSAFFVAVGVFAAWIYLRSTATDRLLHDGVEGTGTVIEVIEPKAVTAVVNNGYVRRSIRLSVERPDKKKTYEAVLRDLFKVEELPKPGDKIALRIDPEDATRIMAAPIDKPVDKPVDANGDANGDAATDPA